MVPRNKNSSVYVNYMQLIYNIFQAIFYFKLTIYVNGARKYIQRESIFGASYFNWKRDGAISSYLSKGKIVSTFIFKLYLKIFQMNKGGKIQSRFFTGHYSMAEVNSICKSGMGSIIEPQFVWRNTNRLDENHSLPWKFLYMVRTRKLSHKIKLAQK